MGKEICFCRSDLPFSTWFSLFQKAVWIKFYLHLSVFHAEILTWANSPSWICSPQATLIQDLFFAAVIGYLPSFPAWLVRSWEGQGYELTRHSASQALVQHLLRSVKTWRVPICGVLLQFNKAIWNSHFKLNWLCFMSLNMKTPDNPTNLNLSKTASKSKILPTLFKSDGAHLCAS